MLKEGEGRLHLYSVARSSISIDLERSVEMGNKVMCLSGWCTSCSAHTLFRCGSASNYQNIRWLNRLALHEETARIPDFNIREFYCGVGKRRKRIQIKTKTLN